MANTKMLRPNVRIDAYYPEAFADKTQPTAAELNNAVFGFNISCAVTDDYTLAPTDSDTDDSISVCDVGGVENPTFRNYEASLDGFRQDRTGTFVGSVYETFFNLFKAVDVPYILVVRVGYKADVAYASGQDISMFGVVTDYPTDLVGDNEMLRLGARFKNDGFINTFYEVA